MAPSAAVVFDSDAVELTASIISKTVLILKKMYTTLSVITRISSVG